MHDHNNNNHDSSMMWMMVICCLAPLLFLLIAGKGLTLQGWTGWSVAAIALGMIIYHFWQMKKHGSHGSNMPQPNQQNINQDQQSLHEHDHH